MLTFILGVLVGIVIEAKSSILAKKLEAAAAKAL